MEFLIFAKLLMDDTATTTQTADTSADLVMVVFKAAIAVYLAVIAIRGKGKVIDNEYPKCKPEVYRLVMRLVSGFAALVILANSVFEFLAGSAYGEALSLTTEQYTALNNVLWALGLVSLLALIVLNIVLSDRKAMEAARKKQEQERLHPTKSNDPLRAAFVFDDDETDEADKKNGSRQEKENQEQPK